MKKTILSLFAFLALGTTFSAIAQEIDDENMYMNWSYASGIDTPKPQSDKETVTQVDTTQTTAGGYTYDNYYSATQTVQPTYQQPMMQQGMMMAPQQPVFTQISAAQAQTNGQVQYVNNPVKVQYPITRQYPVSVQYPVTVQRDITVQRPVVMQQPIVVQRPVVMQQPVMVQHQPTMVQQQPIYMQQQPTFVQQQPVIVQAPGTTPLQPMQAYSVTGIAVQSTATYPDVYSIGN